MLYAIISMLGFTQRRCWRWAQREKKDDRPDELFAAKRGERK